MRRFRVVTSLLLMALLLCFTACQGAAEKDGYTVKILLRETEGIIIDGDNLVEVDAGKMITFKVKIAEGYVYVGNTANAEYDPEDGKLRLMNVIAPETIDMIVVPEAQAIHFDIKSNIANASVSASAYVLGSEGSITLKAEDTKGHLFAGWSVGGFLDEGGTLLSDLMTYEIFISKDTVVYANFTTMPSYEIVYLMNGGRDTETGGDSFIVTETYKETFALQQTLWHNGRFVREGYSAIGFSTEAASYEDYASANDIPEFSNMGGVCEVADGHKELYVVWAKEASPDEFTYESRSVSYVVDSRYEWGQLKKKEQSEQGIVITGWSGSADTLTIPEAIDGLPVLAIGENAFSGSIEKLVIPRTVKNIEDGAFANLDGLREVVFFDSVVMVNDGCFPTTVETVVLNSQRLPVYSGAIEGSFAVKYDRLRSLADQKKITVISGSSTLNGLNSRYMEELLPGYNVINYGTNVANPLTFFIDVVGKYSTEGDIIVYAPEFTDQKAMGKTSIHAKMFRGNEQCYDIFRDVNMSEYTQFWDSFEEFQIGDKNDSSLVPALHQQGKEYQLEAELNRYGDRSTVRSSVAGNFGGANSVFNYSILKADTLNMLAERVSKNGATLVMSFATHDENVTAHSAREKSECDKFTNDCAEKLDFPVISNVRDYIMEHKYFFDSEWHPNDKGADIRTETLARDIKNYLANPNNY